MERIHKSKRTQAILVAVLAIIISSAFVLPKALAVYNEKDSDLLYTTDKVVMRGMPVKDKATGKAITTPIKFRYWDATLQEFQGEVTSKDGIIPDVELFKGHHYIFYSEDANYITYNPNGKGVNIYLVMNETGSKVVNDRYYPGKGSETIDAFLMNKRNTVSNNPEEEKRVKVSLPVFYANDDSDDFDFGNTKIRFTSDTDFVEVPIKYGYVNAKLIEDMNYTVTAVSDNFTLDPFPLTVKDHSEDGRDKSAYMHFSCGPVQWIILKDKSEAHKNDTIIKSTSGKTSVTGTNFMKGSYILRDRIVKKEIPELKGKDYQVIDIDTINLYRNELSKISAGDFKVTTEIPADKTVSKVYYIGKDGALNEVASKQSGNLVTFDMNSVGVYDNVIVFKQNDVPKLDVAINGNAEWKDAHTVEVKLNSGDFTIPEDGAAHAYMMTLDGSDKVYLTKDDKLVKEGNKLIIKLKKSYHDYGKYDEFGLDIGSLESAEGGEMSDSTSAHLISNLKFKLKSISYEEPLEKEYNVGTIVANLTGENFYFGEKQGNNYSLLPETTINGNFDGSINSALKLDVKIIDNEHAKVTVSNIPENTTGKDQKWAVRIFRGWAVALTPETGADSYVTIKSKDTGAVAKEHTVTFNSNGGSNIPSQKVKEGMKAAVPKEPSREGYVFAGWYTDNGYTTSFNFDNPIMSDVTAYAKWDKKPAEPTTHIVAFDSNGGSNVPSQTVKDGDKVSIPQNPTKTGHKFNKWMNGSSAYDFETPVKGNITLTASWIADTYSVSFDTDGGSAVSGQSVKYGELATKPTNPTKKGYIFAGWYTNKNYTTEFDFNKSIMSTTVIYAKWDAEAPQPGHNDVTYIAKGDKEVTWVKGSNKNATLAFMAEKNDENNNTFRKFQKVMIDGHEVDAKNYSAKEGSVLISFNANYLDTLEVGDHKVQAVFTDGVSKESILKVAAMPSSNDNGNTTAQGTATSNKDGNISKTGGKTTISNGVRTGDESNMLGYLIMLLAASGVGTGIYRKKNQ